jgi:hypothetical protein
VQGAILSVNLFIEKPLVKIMGYADDWTIYLEHHANIPIIQTQLQDTVDNLENWAERNGFHFSQTKKVNDTFLQLATTTEPTRGPKKSP